MTALTTTQRFIDNHNMVQGSLSFVTVELKDAGHKYWEREVTGGTAGVNLKKGIEYTVVNPGGANSSIADWTGVGFKGVDDAGAARKPNAGEKFIADDGTDSAEGSNIAFATDFHNDTKVRYGNNHFALQTIVQAISSRASIAYIGNAPDEGTLVADDAGKINFMFENAGYQNERGAEHRDGVSGDPVELELRLNQMILGKDYDPATDTKVFVVTKFNF